MASPPSFSPSSRKPLSERVLTLTATFETSMRPPDCFGIASPDFDGQGLSFGALQWNIGQDTLQHLFRDIIQRDPANAQILFGSNWDAFKKFILTPVPTSVQLDYVKGWQYTDAKGRLQVAPEWRQILYKIGTSQAGINAQVYSAEKKYFSKALSLAQRLDLTTERGIALCFDTCVQQGTLKSTGLEKYDATGFGPNSRDEDRMPLVAHLCSEQANPRWAKDVLARRMTIANGHGIAHGLRVNLDDYDLPLEEYLP